MGRTENYLLMTIILQAKGSNGAMCFVCECEGTCLEQENGGGEAGVGQRGKAEWSHTLPPHSGCVPLHEPLA